jgi:hypothetical protein
MWHDMCIYKLRRNLLAATMSGEWALLLIVLVCCVYLWCKSYYMPKRVIYTIPWDFAFCACFLFEYRILPYKVSSLALVCVMYIAIAVYTRGPCYIDQYWVPFHNRQPTLATLVLVLIFVASFALGWIGLCLMLRIKVY